MVKERSNTTANVKSAKTNVNSLSVQKQLFARNIKAERRRPRQENNDNDGLNMYEYDDEEYYDIEEEYRQILKERQDDYFDVILEYNDDWLE